MIGRSTPSVRTWFPDEIENAIKAVDQANYDVAQHIPTPEMRMYRLGYEAAIDAMVTAFGLDYRRSTFTSARSPRRNSTR